jgi:flagellum-specific peptidoglycan hydrolase FlgJ
MKDIIMILFLLGMFIVSGIFIDKENKDTTNDETTIMFKHDSSCDFFNDSLNKESLMQAIIFYDLLYPEIVFDQAILETGHFKSRICREYNNLFGLYDSYNNDYYRFNHWYESVEAYKKYIQYKYVKGDYYEFLKLLGYAEDPEYINKLRKLNDQRRNK